MVFLYLYFFIIYFVPPIRIFANKKSWRYLQLFEYIDNFYHVPVTNLTITSATSEIARPINSFMKSLQISLNATRNLCFFSFFLSFPTLPTVRIATCLPARSQINTHVVLIGMLDHSLNIRRIMKYTKSTIVAQISLCIFVFEVTIFPTGPQFI